jgi:hypothetical protein
LSFMGGSWRAGLPKGGSAGLGHHSLMQWVAQASVERKMPELIMSLHYLPSSFRVDVYQQNDEGNQSRHESRSR